MKRYFLTCILLLTLFSSTYTQTVIRLQLAPTGIRLKSQLWNLALINTSAETQLLQVEVLVSDAATNRKVFSGLSRVLTVPKGILQVTQATASPITYRVLSPDFDIAGNSDGLLPAGSYEVCFSASVYPYNSKAPVSVECTFIDVEPLSPPFLVSPADRDSIETSNPLFTWSPPGPLLQFQDLSYDFTLVEVKGIQSGADALQQNPPLYFGKNVPANSLPYSEGLPPLEENKVYAWQIAAKNSNRSVAKSDVWTFRIKKGMGSASGEKPDYYLQLKKEAYETSVVGSPVIKYNYLNELNDRTAVVKLYDVTVAAKKEVSLSSLEVPLVYGENFKELETEKAGLSDKHFYLLELTNSRGEHWCLKFQYRKSY